MRIAKWVDVSAREKRWDALRGNVHRVQINRYLNVHQVHIFQIGIWMFIWFKYFKSVVEAPLPNALHITGCSTKKLVEVLTRCHNNVTMQNYDTMIMSVSFLVETTLKSGYHTLSLTQLTSRHLPDMTWNVFIGTDIQIHKKFYNIVCQYVCCKCSESCVTIYPSFSIVTLVSWKLLYNKHVFF